MLKIYLRCILLSMRIILFLLFTAGTAAIGFNEIKGLYKDKKYSVIISYYQQNPELFNGLQELEVLAQSYNALGNTKMAVRVCAQVIDQSPEKMCLRILRDAKERNPYTYDLEIGWFFMERGRIKDAFSKFYSLVRKHPQDKKLRKALAQVFQSMQLYDHMLEQVWQMEATEESLSLKQWLKLVTYRLKKRLSKQDLDLLVEQPDSYYLFIFLEQKPHPNYYEPLLAFYKEKIVKDATEEDQLHYANLLFIGGQFEEARTMADQLLKVVQRPLAVLSLESLLLRLPPKPKAPSPGEKDGVKTVDQREIALQLTTLSTNSADLSKSKTQTIDLFAPLDLLELKMATLQNLKPFEDLHKTVREKLASAKNLLERRWIYEQVKEPLMELDSSHLDPNIHPVERYFEKTEDGKKFTETLVALANEAKAMDRQNSRRFEGELERIRAQMNAAQSAGAKKRILTTFYYNWKAIAEGPYTDIRIKGAWEHYIETAEGERLLEYVQSELRNLGLNKGEIPYQKIQRY